MKTFLIQVIYGDQFEDLYIVAASEKAALAKAKKVTTLNSRWSRFVI